VLQVERLPDFSPVVNLHARLGTSDGVYALPWRSKLSPGSSGMKWHSLLTITLFALSCGAQAEVQPHNSADWRTFEVPDFGTKVLYPGIFSVRPVSLKWVLDSDLSALTDVPSCPFTLVPTKPARPPELT
jgi:hypothetical protein